MSYAYWERHLHKATDLAAVKFTVSKKPTAIIGVLPPNFSFPDDTQVWMARETEPRLPSRTAHSWQVVAHLRDGASMNQARDEASAIAGQIYKQNGPHDINMVDAAILPLRAALTASIKPALLVLLGGAGLLLLMACANVMNLSLAQASARGGELAVCAALGASRWRLVRQFLTEALLLCLLGGCFGILVAYLGVSSFTRVCSDVLEMAEIERGHSIAKMERRPADQQVFERNPDAFGFLPAFDASGQSRDVERYRVHRHILAQALDKG